jgi:hypothetical protein
VQLPDQVAPLPTLVWCLKKLSDHGIRISNHFIADSAADGVAAARRPVEVAFTVHDEDWPVEQYIPSRPSSVGVALQAISADTRYLGPFEATLATELAKPTVSGNWKHCTLSAINHEGTLDSYLGKGFCIVLQEWVRLCHGFQVLAAKHNRASAVCTCLLISHMCSSQPGRSSSRLPEL